MVDDRVDMVDNKVDDMVDDMVEMVDNKVDDMVDMMLMFTYLFMKNTK